MARVALGVFMSHVALVLWPCAYFVARDLLRQRRWTERLKSVALLALCLWLACGGTRVVIEFWAGL